MKKKLFSILLIIFCILLVGCSFDKEEEKKYTINENQELVEPIINWKEVTNYGKGSNVLVMEVQNINNRSIDFGLTATYYLKGEKVGKSTTITYNSLKTEEKGLIWHNYQVPNCDQIEVTFDYIREAIYPDVEYKVLKNEKTHNIVKTKLEINGQYTRGQTAVVFYYGRKIINVTIHNFLSDNPNDNYYEHDALKQFDRYTLYTNVY